MFCESPSSFCTNTHDDMQFLLCCIDITHRCRDLDSELNSTHQKLVKLEQQHVMLTQTIRTELDVLVETGETTSEHKYSDSIGGGGGSDLLTNITVGIVVTLSVFDYQAMYLLLLLRPNITHIVGPTS